MPISRYKSYYLRSYLSIFREFVRNSDRRYNCGHLTVKHEVFIKKLGIATEKLEESRIIYRANYQKANLKRNVSWISSETKNSVLLCIRLPLTTSLDQNTRYPRWPMEPTALSGAPPPLTWLLSDWQFPFSDHVRSWFVRCAFCLWRELPEPGARNFTSFSFAMKALG